MKNKKFIKWEAEWWEEINDQATDFYEIMFADNEKEVKQTILKYRPNARKIKVTEYDKTD